MLTEDQLIINIGGWMTESDKSVSTVTSFDLNNIDISKWERNILPELSKSSCYGAAIILREKMLMYTGGCDSPYRGAEVKIILYL